MYFLSILWNHCCGNTFPISSVRASFRELEFIMSALLKASDPQGHGHCGRSVHFCETQPLSVLLLQDLESGHLRRASTCSLKAWAWAKEYPADYDHVLAYWGNYSATCAYIFHRLIGRTDSLFYISACWNRPLSISAIFAAEVSLCGQYHHL